MKSVNRSFRAPRIFREALDEQAALHFDSPQAQWLSEWIIAADVSVIRPVAWLELASPLLDETLKTVYIRLHQPALKVLIKTRCELCWAFDYNEDFQLRHAFAYLFAAGEPSWEEYFGPGAA